MMAWWLCVTPCGVCEEDARQCACCPLRDRPIGLFVRQAEARPATAINGPAAGPDDLLRVIADYCVFSPVDGFLRLRGIDCE